MIIIDGHKSNIALANYGNLEEVLVHIAEQENMSDRIVTDVLVNNEPFSELYPHQAEDISSANISALELRTVSHEQMSSDIAHELPKVVNIITFSSKQIAELFRAAELAEALEMLQDMVAVSRDFLDTLGVVISTCQVQAHADSLIAFGNSFSDLLEEICDAMQDEDWMLVADLLEFEFIPECDKLKTIANACSKSIDSQAS